MHHNNPSNPHFNRNPNSPFYPHHFIPGFTSDDVRRSEYDHPRNAENFRELIQRELEKEQIRAEIIAEEIHRRRILEAEVRREMMLERELSIRHGELGFGFTRPRGPMRVDPPRVPLLMSSEHRSEAETRPFQRDPNVAGGANGVVSNVAKPNANLDDIKRKAMAPSAGAAIEILKKQKTNKELSCALCGITVTSERGLNEHLQGKKHKTRERGMLAQKSDVGARSASGLKNDEEVRCAEASTSKDNKTAIKSKEISVEERENGVANAPVADKLKKKFRYFCEICEVGVYSLKVFNNHKRGKKHHAKLSEHSETVDASPIEASVQIALMEKNKKAEFVAKEIKEDNEREKVETEGDDVDSDLNRVEGKFEVLETKKDDVDSEVNQVEDKFEVLETKGDVKLDDFDSYVNRVVNNEKVQVAEGKDVGCDVNQVEDKETVLEIVGGETVAPKSSDLTLVYVAADC